MTPKAAFRALGGEGASVFTLGYLFALPHELYADLCYELDDGRRLWGGEFPRTVPAAIDAGPLVDHEWLFEAAAWPFWAHGLFWIFALLCTAATAATPLLASAIARRCGASPWTANAVGYVSIAGCVTSYAVRPQSFAVIAFGVVLWLLLGPSPRPWLVGLAVAFWANVHGSAALAPALVALVALARTIAEPAAPRARLALAVVAAGLGSLATPLGAGLYAGAAQYTAPVFQTADWRPLSLGYPVEFLALALYGAVLISGGVALARANAVALALLAALGLAWFEFVRFLPFFAIAAVPALALALGPDGARQGRRRRARHPTEAGRAPAPLLMALPLAVALGLASAVFAPLASRPAPVARVTDDLVRRAGYTGPIFVAFEAATYLELRRDPVRVLLDAHATPFGPAVWADEATIDAARPGWAAALARRGITGAIASDNSALAGALANDARWSRCSHESGLTLFARNDAASRRIGWLRCKPWTGASSPTPIPNSMPRSPRKSAGRSTISN